MLKKILLFLLPILFIFLLWEYGVWPFEKEWEEKENKEMIGVPEASGFNSNDRLLVVAPHPDDEVLGCGGTMAAALEVGAEVFIIWMCAGDGFEIDAELMLGGHNKNDMIALGEMRLQEALNAGDSLNIPSENLFLMGYPDGGLLTLFHNQDSLYTSTNTDLNISPYSNSLSYKEDYKGSLAFQHLDSLIQLIQPTIVYATAPQEQNDDHQAAGFFTKSVLESQGQLELLRYYLIHGGDYLGVGGNFTEYPMPKGLHTELPLPAPLVAEDCTWIQFDLTQEQMDLKYRAIQAHVSQVDIMQGYMQSWVRTNEMYTTSDNLGPVEHTKD
jgi:LmbE family N-acetylglucosaminyl deacetylase